VDIQIRRKLALGDAPDKNSWSQMLLGLIYPDTAPGNKNAGISAGPDIARNSSPIGSPKTNDQDTVYSP
jgi:hypothetical protein